MLDLGKAGRIYPPETIAVMTAAFDTVCRSLSQKISEDDDVRKTLALIIIRHIDQGERDPARLSAVAARELAGLSE